MSDGADIESRQNRKDCAKSSKMEPWFATSLILCTFGFLKELRPIDPYVTEYIIEFKNVTAEEVIHVAFPISTYSSLASLAVILFITDLLRYKPIVCLEGLCHVLTWGILTLFSGLTSVIVVEIFYGIACSAENAYNTYIYAQVESKYYKKVTSQTRSARLAGKFFGGVLAQLLISTSLMNYHQLNYITLTCTCIGAFFTFLLHKVKGNKQFILKSSLNTKSILEASPKSDNALQSLKNEDISSFEAGKETNFSVSALWRDFRAAYGNSYVLKWSLWWALASAGQYQVINYIQALWEKIREEGGNEDLYNGAVKATHTFLSAILTLGIGYTQIKWERWSEVTLTTISIVQGFMLVYMACTKSLYLAYLSYIIFRTIHPVMLTAASAEVAQHIPEDSYGLIFGINMFLALSLQTILTLVVSDMKGLALDERSQYIVYGICFIILGILIGGTSLISICSRICKSKGVKTKTRRQDQSIYLESNTDEIEKTDFITSVQNYDDRNEAEHNLKVNL